MHSLSEDKPLKSGNFKPEDKAFESFTVYAAWQFTYQPASAGAQPSTQNAPAAPQPGAATAGKAH